VRDPATERTARGAGAMNSQFTDDSLASQYSIDDALYSGSNILISNDRSWIYFIFQESYEVEMWVKKDNISSRDIIRALSYLSLKWKNKNY